MDKGFRQKIIITIIGGLFILMGAYISQQNDSKSNYRIENNSPAAAISYGNNSNAQASSNINIIDNRVHVENGQAEANFDE
ncbi:MAG: hypothetical protein CL565_00915 [Alphaproteobacteria bacterium]|nr:hypothetical protein [Alphaproteobacteria bacterium]|tara:strand:- start:1349 stop:1591 length:243 start_codon:yes stop_codon:yes gene_type:complete